MKMDSWQKSGSWFGYLILVIAIICNYSQVYAAVVDPNSPLAAAATVNPLSHLNVTATKSIEASESTALIPNEKQRYARVNFIGSTEPGSNSYETPILSSEMTSTNSVALTGPIFVSSDTSPFTIIEIANPNDEQMAHILIGTNGPNQRESEAITRGLDWLVEKRSSDYGWVNDTHMVILAKELSGERDFADSTDSHIQVIQNLEDLLSIKQMSIEILSLIDHHHHSVMPKSVDVANLARYTLALGALCKDPKHFMNQHDLLSMLQHHESSDDQVFVLSTLAVCSLGEHVRKRQIRQLIDIALENTQNIETTALAVLALRCIMTDHHNRHLEHFLRKSTLRLALMQTTQGNVGSLRSTALTLQALQDLNIVPSEVWDRTAAIKWILDRQRDDGSWSDEPLADGQDPNLGIGLTADIILALGRKGFGAVRMLQCNHILSEPTEYRHDTTEQKLASPVALTPSAPSTPAIRIETVSYTYTLWFSIQPDSVDTVSLAMTSPRNITFYQAMVQASDIDPRFVFEAHDWPNGHYIHTIGGHNEDPVRSYYWILYRLPDSPDLNNLPGNKFMNSVGVDEISVENNYHYLYWFKKL